MCRLICLFLIYYFLFNYFSKEVNKELFFYIVIIGNIMLNLIVESVNFSLLYMDIVLDGLKIC